MESATIFSRYFGSVFKPLNTSSVTNNSFSQPYSLQSNCNYSPDDVFMALHKLKSVLSHGSDWISSRLLFQCRFTLFFPFYILFRKCMDEGVFPTVLKITSVTPTLNYDPSSVTNYRPISISSHIGKIFESIVFNCVEPRLNHILILQQHVFRNGKITITSSR